MIITTMKCPCCGKEFFSKYWEGGYIDHVTNFVGNMDAYKNRDSVKDMAMEICFVGNDLRQSNVRRDFLKCFLTWKGFDQEFKAKVKRIVDEFGNQIQNAEDRVKCMKAKMTPLEIALFKGDDLDDSFWGLFDDVVQEV